jgi:hypothetical protein
LHWSVFRAEFNGQVSIGWISFSFNGASIEIKKLYSRLFLRDMNYLQQWVFALFGKLWFPEQRHSPVVHKNAFLPNKFSHIVLLDRFELQPDWEIWEDKINSKSFEVNLSSSMDRRDY